MTILENKYAIKYTSSNYVLFLKNKNNKFDIKGYFINLESVFKKIYKLKLISKEDYNDFVKYTKRLENCANYIYKPLENLKKVINDKVQSGN